MLILNPVVNSIKDTLESGIIGLLLMIDGIVYWLISKLFSLYSTLAAAEILRADAFDEISGNIYLFIGILALFFLAFSLLKAMVNPDEINKGTKKIAVNLITSILLLTFVPTIFDYAFDFQNAIFEENIIGKIFTGSEIEYDNEMPSVCYGNTNSNEDNDSPVTLTTFQLQGNQLAMSVLNAFVYTSENQEANAFKVDEATSNADYLEQDIDSNPKNNCGTHWRKAKKYMVYSGKFDYISTFVENIVSESPTMGYRFLISTICGGFLVYILLSFCLDMGIRVVKMSFLQIIAPIPIIMRIAPSKQGQFNKWVNITLSTYVEVFVRIIIINLVVYIASTVLSDITLFENNGVGIFGQVIIILGLFAFAKQAPKLIGDLLGFGSTNLKLGIRQKLKDGGAYIAGGAIGGAVTAGTRNLFHSAHEGANRFNEANGVWNRTRALVGGVVRGTGSTIAGAGSAFFRSGYNARNANNETDMRNAASQGATTTINNRDRREAYRASHGDSMRGVMQGHISDTLRNLGQWAGIDSLAELRNTQSKIQIVADARSSINDKLNKMIQNEKERVASSAVNINGVGNFTRLADMENELQIMKSTGKTSSGSVVSAADLTNMDAGIERLKNTLKNDIMNGTVIKRNSQGDFIGMAQDVSKMDGELKSLITDYRTKAAANIDSIRKATDIAATDNLMIDLTAAISNNGQLDTFIASGDANKLFSSGNKVVSNANNNARQEINNHLDRSSNNNS